MHGDIIDIKKLRKAVTTIEIPGFEGIPTIKVKVKTTDNDGRQAKYLTR